MKLQYRINLATELGKYILENGEAWQMAKAMAEAENGWFIGAFIDEAATNIAQSFLQKALLEKWIEGYQLPPENSLPKTVGIVMAGNIPLVGFHDFLCGFLCGHKLLMKPSAKDAALIKHLVAKLIEWEPLLAQELIFSENLRQCDAYIATGSNNTGRYFDFYFKKFPHIIRRNRSAVAVLTGAETLAELDLFAKDLLVYFGQGCRNVSKFYVPAGYNFEPLVRALDGYLWMENHHKFKNNYDYNLSILLLNNQYYMTNGVLLFVENKAIFSPISVAYYEFYDGLPPQNLMQQFPDELQVVVGNGGLAFGEAQKPTLTNYADGVDTMAFLKEL